MLSCKIGQSQLDIVLECEGPNEGLETVLSQKHFAAALKIEQASSPIPVVSIVWVKDWSRLIIVELAVRDHQLLK
jgi:hypothetical protein